MKVLLAVFAGGFFIGILAVFLLLNKSEGKGKVLSISSVNIAATLPLRLTLTLTPTPSPIATPTSTPKPTPTKKPKPTAIPVPSASSQEINGFIDRFSAQYNVNPNILRHLAVCESGFRQLAVNGPYIGLYQFGPATWQNNRRLMGEDANLDLRASAEEAVQTAAYILSIGRIGIWPNCQP